MVKEWKNENLGINYFYLSSKNGNAVLTSDGVLIPYKQFKNMSLNEYNSVKATNAGYNYKLSRQMEKLVKNQYVKEEPPVKNIQPLFNEIKKEEPPVIPQPEVIEPPKVEIPVEEPKEIEVKKEEQSVIKEESQVVRTPERRVKKSVKHKSFNVFDFFYPKIMLCLTIICSLLSIYFTATYLQRLQNTTIAYAISTSMLLFGVIGFQIARREKNQKRYSRCFVYFFTSTLVILFSMLSSIDVNYTKYKQSHKVTEIEYNVDEGKKLSYDILKDELNENKKQIENLNDDIKFQQTQYVLSWDSEKGKNVLIEGKITGVAQEKITEDNLRIQELQERNKEINKLLIEYSQEGTTISKEESMTDKAKTLTDLLGSIFGISGNVIQLIFLLVPSFFIDIINILSISIYCDRKEDD